jgi:hypothetical protein
VALDLLLQDAELRVALATRARRLIEERFYVYHNVAGWQSVFLGEVRDANRVRVL